MYETSNSACVSNKQEIPYHIEVADKAFNALIELPHRQQTDAFKYLQKKLADFRLDQNKAMQNELTAHAEDVSIHADGTAVIASGIK